MDPLSHSLLSLLELHHDLDKLLAEHQAKLIQGEIKSAIALWSKFQSALSEHAEDEESKLLPLYQQRVTIPPGGTIELFLAEHKKIRAFLSEITDLLQDLQGVTPPETYRIVALIEREYEFKKLLEHHDMREMNFLYPLLDRCTTPEERRDLFSHMRQTI